MLLGLLALILFVLAYKSCLGGGLPVTYKTTVEGPIAKIVGVLFFLLGLGVVGFMVYARTQAH